MQESLDLLNLTEEEKLVRAKNEENKAKMEESQSETIGDGKVTLKYIYQEGTVVISYTLLKLDNSNKRIFIFHMIIH